MYAIGTSDFDFIKINSRTLMNYSMVYEEIYRVLYECDLEKASIFKDYESAIKTLEEIKSRREDITFENNNIIGAILDKEKEFNVDELKIYQLTPLECKVED